MRVDYCPSFALQYSLQLSQIPLIYRCKDTKKSRNLHILNKKIIQFHTN